MWHVLRPVLDEELAEKTAHRAFITIASDEAVVINVVVDLFSIVHASWLLLSAICENYPR